MPIVIKELFPSDPISEAVEKINFNFDQLLLSGGGPPGPIGLPGPPGPIGPQGSRGDHWFVGPSAFGQTADHDGGGPLQIQDHFLDTLGDVWYFFDDGMGSTGWTYSGINLAGPPGASGNTGGSLEWSIYPGILGNLFSAGYGPGPVPMIADDANLNFIVPLGPTKNGIIVGDPDWFYTKLSGWNDVPNTPGPVYSQSTPRLTVIQRTVDYFGSNGIQIGAYGLTGSTSSTTNLLDPTNDLPIGATVNALDFFNIGIGIIGTYNRELQPAYFSHSGMIKTFQRDITIEAGNDTFIGNTSPNIRMKSNGFTIQSWDTSRWISSGFDSPVSSPTTRSNVISINSINPSLSGPTPYIQLQGTPGVGGLGTVLVGPASDTSNLIPYDNSYQNYSITISRTINTVATNQAQIIFVNPINATTATDWNAKFVSFNEGSTLTQARGIVLSTSYFGVLGKADTINALSKPVFPFHVNQNGSAVVLPTIPWVGATQPTNNYGWLAGFDKYDSTSPFPNPNLTLNNFARGIGINYINSSRYDTNNIASIKTYREIAINTYWTQSMTTSNNDFTVRTFPIGSGSFGIGTRENPHLSIQTDNELLYGNLALGFVPGGTDNSTLFFQLSAYAPWSKLSINGSFRVGSTANGYHTVNRSNSWFRNGAFIEGPILRGSTSFSQLTQTIDGSGLTSGQLILMIEGSTNLGGTGIGISSIGWNLSDYFLAKGGSSSTKTAYALADGKSGMKLGSTAGDAYLVSSNQSTFNATNDATQTSENLRFSNRGDFNTFRTGIQTRGVYAESPKYLTTGDIMSFGEGVVGSASGIGPAKAWRYISHTIPTDRSIIFLDLSLPSPNRIQWTTPNSNVITGVIQQSYLNASFNANDNISNRLTGWLGRRYFLSPGQYDGQHITIVVGAVHPSNEFSIYQGGPLPAGDVSATPIPDRHILAANPVSDVPQGATNIANAPWIGQPYPITGASSAANPPTANMGYANTGSINNWQSESYTIGTSSTPNYFRYSAFVVRSWRTINLRWLKVRSNYTGIDNYAWVEISRENLGSQDLFGDPFNLQFSPVGTPSQPSIPSPGV